MNTSQTPALTTLLAKPMAEPSARAQIGLDGHPRDGAQSATAVEAQTSAPARQATASIDCSLGRDQNSRPSIPLPAPRPAASAGSDTSPQAMVCPTPIGVPPAGISATAAATGHPTHISASPLPCKTDQVAHFPTDTHSRHGGLAEDFPDDHRRLDAHVITVAGDQAQPTANREPASIHAAPSAVSSPREAEAAAWPIERTPLAGQTPPPAKGTPNPISPTLGAEEAGSPAPAIGFSAPKEEAPGLADPLLALAADVLDDLESVRIANENRLRQLTRDEEDSDGEERGFGLTLDHPDVARLNLLVVALADAEKAATKNLEKRLREHLLYPWLKRQKGVGDKQAARLLASIGDPYMRPEMVGQDGTVEPVRPRTVSELWAYTGYHVVNFPAGQRLTDSHLISASGGKTGHPDHRASDTQTPGVGVAPKRARGQRANWSSTAKMRAYLIAESTMKQLKRTCPSDEELGYATHADSCECSRYRKVYDTAREKYVAAVHHAECVRCGPKGKPAAVGSDLSRKHKQARALRIVSKELLKDLWREARRIHLGEEEAP